MIPRQGPAASRDPISKVHVYRISQEVGPTAFAGVFDALSAKLAEQAGFRPAYASRSLPQSSHPEPTRSTIGAPSRDERAEKEVAEKWDGVFGCRRRAGCAGGRTAHGLERPPRNRRSRLWLACLNARALARRAAVGSRPRPSSGPRFDNSNSRRRPGS
jgi:hypothetical protein